MWLKDFHVRLGDCRLSVKPLRGADATTYIAMWYGFNFISAMCARQGRSGKAGGYGMYAIMVVVFFSPDLPGSSLFQVMSVDSLFSASMMSRGRGQCCSFLRMPTRRDWYNGVVPAERDDVAKAETDGDVDKG